MNKFIRNYEFPLNDDPSVSNRNFAMSIILGQMYDYCKMFDSCETCPMFGKNGADACKLIHNCDILKASGRAPDEHEINRYSSIESDTAKYIRRSFLANLMQENLDLLDMMCDLGHCEGCPLDNGYDCMSILQLSSQSKSIRTGNSRAYSDVLRPIVEEVDSNDGDKVYTWDSVNSVNVIPSNDSKEFFVRTPDEEEKEIANSLPDWDKKDDVKTTEYMEPESKDFEEAVKAIMKLLSFLPY